ncbi:MAG: transcription-repair coupling factor [Anaerolineae bacterium]|nr:transcription-repair coupling factor [Anaerolineae bacterium]
MKIIDELRGIPAYQQVLSAVKQNEVLPALGLSRAARMIVAAALHGDLERPVLILTARNDHALKWMGELDFWSHDVPHYLFPEPSPLFYEHAAWGTNTRRERLSGLSYLAAYHLPGAARLSFPPIIVAPVRAIMTRTLPRRDFIKNSKVLKVGQQVQPESLQRQWVEIGYQAVDTVLEPGHFSRRGGILDVWVPAEAFPVRLDFFGDELDTIRRFDPHSQRTIEKLQEMMFTPARELLPGKALEKGLPPEQIDEYYLGLVHPAHASLLDYLPSQALVLVDDMNYLQTLATEVEEQAVKLRHENISEGLIPEDFPIPYLPWSEIVDSLTGHPFLELGYAGEEATSDLAALFTPGERFGGRLKPFIDHVLDFCQSGQRVVLVSRQISRLKELWQERINHTSLNNFPEFVDGQLNEGWTLALSPSEKLSLMTDGEIFGWEKPGSRYTHRHVAEAPEAVYADLKPGDWVVHVDYGIGRFMGLVTRVLDGIEREFFCVEYDNGDQLYVPVHQADRITRYIGPSEEPPTPTRLGTSEWSSTKEKVTDEVREVARDLLELYATRQLAEGFAFQADTVWQKELEASFPYVETADQIKAIEAVKRDMEAKRPMDRLLCGDVGYGKTEVALRAAFKAVNDSKQVAVLVPTTVLAQQHYTTFRQRLAAYPVEVEMLSRFRTHKEQDEIIKRLADGKVDIIIGTHRLIQPDVLFKDLGLVIIDEEQRFGVTHKEHFKKLRTEVDVLTLTATPIPRTLYMALTGVRDISNINTPPEERQPVVTHIGPYSPKLVRQACLRELERGGQVFFVHNRVQTIHAMQMHLNKLVPEARVAVAHGQMPEGELSSVMEKFSSGDMDILLCTSIIESGLDIPNANTLIVDRGDIFGLAQLYQLRGRVGRGAQRAYAYFFRHRNKAPTPEGYERLETIAENTQLGAGYSIAMRDLEMRGAGELLGVRQHGYIASVGFHLYTRLLAQAVRDLRRFEGLTTPSMGDLEDLQMAMPVSVDLPLSIGIPAEYVPNKNMRLQLYRRLADLRREDELKVLMDEFADRFGPLPEQTANLFYQMTVKLYAERAELVSVTVESDQIVLRLAAVPNGLPARILPEVGKGVRVGKNAYWIPEMGADWKEKLIEVLSAIIEVRKKAGLNVT